MKSRNVHKVLDGLPPYGPMYIPISQTGEQFYNEGLVVEFTDGNDSNWVANFHHGLTEFDLTHEFDDKSILVIAGGQAYIIDPNKKKPLNTFGGGYKTCLHYDNFLILADDVSIDFINRSGRFWESPRISFDGIDELVLSDNILLGKAYDPMNDANEWIDFSIDLETLEVQGGSYRKYYTDEDEPKQKKKWWQF